MDADILKNLTDPAILFFFLGVTIGLIRSNLEIPAAIAKFLSLYLLMALGFKGGQALADAGLSGDGVKVIGAAIVLALVIPVIWFLVLRKRIDAFDAAAIAATYGSVSAVTFVTASPLRSASRSRSTSRSTFLRITQSLLRLGPERADQSRTTGTGLSMVILPSARASTVMKPCGLGTVARTHSRSPRFGTTRTAA